MSTSAFDVAIVGMSGRFPGAPSATGLWQLLRDGKSGVRAVTDDELAAAEVPTSESSDQRYVRAWAGIEGADQFDATFFGYSPREAAVIDPQQRLFLECAWECLEDAGCDPEKFTGEIGVYAACGMNLYFLNNVAPNESLVKSFGNFVLAVSSDKDNLSTRASYKLGLTGPSVTMQSNCSSSAVAVHHGVNSLLDQECDLVLVGGTSIKAPRPMGYMHERGSTTSPDGQCRSFDKDANGYLIGDGVGVVALKRLDDAIAAQDQIYAVIKGSAVNNDGGAKVSFAAPSKDGQTRVINKALQATDIDPSTITYIESNATGTAMGDVIEIAALQETYGRNADSSQTIAVGSIKPNIGNLDAAAGIAGLIKVALALHHKELPPSINFTIANPQIDWVKGSLAVNTELRSWDTDSLPRRAAFNSFGVGGTNVHIILEEAPQRRSLPDQRPWQIVTCSADSSDALVQIVDDYADHLNVTEDALADVAYTSNVGRKHFSHRTFVVDQSCVQVSEALRHSTGRPAFFQPRVALVFSATCNWQAIVDMDQFVDDTVFKAALEEVAQSAGSVLHLDIRPQLEQATRSTTHSDALENTLCFAAQYGLGKRLKEWGVSPAVVMGSATGELVAASIAGLLPLATAIGMLDMEDSAREQVQTQDPEFPLVLASGGELLASEIPAGTGTVTSLGAIASSDAVAALIEHAPDIIVDIGDGTLAGAISRQDTRPDRVIVSTHPDVADADHTEALLNALGTIWSAGAEIDWKKFHASTRRMIVALPTYRFQRSRYWFNRPASVHQAQGHVAHDLDDPRAKALPADFIAPTAPLAKVVANLWREYLGIERQVGMNEMFLDLGGNSLTAGQIVAELSEIFQVDLNMRMFLDTPTLASQSETLSQVLSEASEAKLFALLESVETIDSAETPNELEYNSHD